MHELLEKYNCLLASIDAWFNRAQQQFAQSIKCCSGCSGCCRGFFDITLLDAALVAQGYQLLDSAQRNLAYSRAVVRLDELRQRWPGFSAPFLLNAMPDSEWTAMPEDDETPCPFLGHDDLCLIYAHRPMTCRLHGLPNIDLSGESFSDDYCSLNFSGSDPLSLPQLRWEFRQVFQQELELFQQFTEQLTGRPLLEVDTLLQLVPLLDFAQTDWRKLNFYTLPGTTEHKK